MSMGAKESGYSKVPTRTRRDLSRMVDCSIMSGRERSRLLWERNPDHCVRSLAHRYVTVVTRHFLKLLAYAIAGVSCTRGFNSQLHELDMYNRKDRASLSS